VDAETARATDRDRRRQAVAALYRQGHSMSAIADELGIASLETVHRDLVGLGVDRRSLSEAVSTARLARTAPLRERLVEQPGGCGSPTCDDPDCQIPTTFARRSRGYCGRRRSPSGRPCPSVYGRDERRAFADLLGAEVA
jgi:transposase-like protein